MAVLPPPSLHGEATAGEDFARGHGLTLSLAGGSGVRWGPPTQSNDIENGLAIEKSIMH